ADWEQSPDPLADAPLTQTRWLQTHRQCAEWSEVADRSLSLPARSEKRSETHRARHQRFLSRERGREATQSGAAHAHRADDRECDATVGTTMRGNRSALLRGWAL